MSIKDLAQTRPEFLPEVFFNGTLEGWGIIESLTGGLQRRHTVKAAGVWNSGANLLTLTENWLFDDGHTDTLAWSIKKAGEGCYSGTEPRVSGTAEGEQSGCAFRWTYTRDTRAGGGKSFVLNFEDWFYLIEEKVAMVRGSAGRLGIPFATGHICYRRVEWF